MKNIFELTRAEQRVVIFVVVILVVAAFTQHFLEMRSRAAPAARSPTTPTASPTVHPPEEQNDADE